MFLKYFHFESSSFTAYKAWFALGYIITREECVKRCVKMIMATQNLLSKAFCFLIPILFISEIESCLSQSGVESFRPLEQKFGHISSRREGLPPTLPYPQPRKTPI